MRNSLQLLVLFVLVGVLLSGCGGGGTPPPPGGNGTGNPLPSVTSLSPTSATAGGAAFTLTVTGSNFVSGTMVNWAGAAHTTMFVSSSSVTASVPANDLSTAGTAQVIVTNPTPGGGSSAAKTFNVNNPAPALTSLSRTSANAGSLDFTLTVTGSGFVSTSVVNWNGSARTTTFGGGTQLTASISEADLAIAGSAHVSVSNPTPGGGSSSNLTFTITPQIANGNALPGSAADLAINATSDVLPVSADAADVQDEIIMTRLDVRFAKSATVAQVNAALANVGAGIVSMSQGLPSVTIGIPKQKSLADLKVVVAHLENSPGILLVSIANLAEVQAIFNGSDAAAAQFIRHLIAARFPAAWNVAHTSVFGDPSNAVDQLCPVSPIPVLVTDFFATPPPASFVNLFPSFEPPVAPKPGVAAHKLEHGYKTATMMAANTIGANPFPFSGCIDLHLIQQAAFYSPNQVIDFFAFSMPANDKFIVNYSLGYLGCANDLACATPDDTIVRPIDRAETALHWKEKTRSRWKDFLIVAAAGNNRDNDSFGIWPGTGDSRFESAPTISRLSDNQFQFVLDDDLWTPPGDTQAEGYVSLKAGVQEQANLIQAIDDAGLTGPDATADNVIVVGSTKSPDPTQILTQHIPLGTLQQSDFSNLGPDISAVGEDVLGLGEGTSFAAPQVTGLASFLWMVQPELRDDPDAVVLTKRAILSNASNAFLDAYATVLSLDQGGVLPTPTTAPMRRLLLDVNNDGKFDENDLTIFLNHLQDANGNAVQPTVPDYSRYDLNGDGFTGGSKTERFDLDRIGSIQYGTTNYSSDVTQEIETKTVDFDETAVNDLQILCYYAYSGMFTGDVAERAHLMAGCAGPVVKVTPGSVTLNVGDHQPFTVTVTGANDPRVTWTTTGSANTIGADGVFTAGATSGTFTVRATSVADPRAFGEATVTINQITCAGALQGNIGDLDASISLRNGSDTKNSNTLLEVSDSLSEPEVDGSADIRYGSGSASVSDTNTGKADPGASGARGTFQDSVVLLPSDPALMGTIIIVTGRATVTGTADVTGDRAFASWGASMGIETGTSQGLNVIVSTLPGQSSGAGGTFSATSSPVTFGIPFTVEGDVGVEVGYACDTAHGEQCPPRSTAGTGTGHATANFQMGNLTVKDQNGNAVGFTVCSFSGFHY